MPMAKLSNPVSNNNIKRKSFKIFPINNPIPKRYCKLKRKSENEMCYKLMSHLYSHPIRNKSFFRVLFLYYVLRQNGTYK